MPHRVGSKCGDEAKGQLLERGDYLTQGVGLFMRLQGGYWRIHTQSVGRRREWNVYTLQQFTVVFLLLFSKQAVYSSPENASLFNLCSNVGLTTFSG